MAVSVNVVLVSGIDRLKIVNGRTPSHFPYITLGSIGSLLTANRRAGHWKSCFAELDSLDRIEEVRGQRSEVKCECKGRGRWLDVL